MSGILAGRRVLVVGASAGIGRAIAVAAVGAGAATVFVARRAAALEAAVAEAGGGSPVAADTTTADGRAALVAGATEALGGPIDLAVSAVGIARLRPLADSDEEVWSATLDVNVAATNLLIRALVPHLAPAAIVGVLSSETVQQPRPGLVAYGASKAALEASLAGWRIEHPELRFSCLAVGPTQPTEFGQDFEPERLGPAFAQWSRLGLIQARFMGTDDVAGFLVTMLAAALDRPGLGVEHLVLRSPSPVAGSYGDAIAARDADR